MSHVTAAASTALSLIALALFGVFASILPFALAGIRLDAPALLTLIQDRFPPESRGCEGPPAAILVPGGGVDTYVVATTQGGRPPGVGERVTAAVELARTYPSAKLVFSGAGEVDPIPLLSRQGIEPGRIVLERKSENTFENAALTASLLRPRPDQCFTLVTSALHMPRAAGSYRAAGFTVSTRSVDYRRADEPNLGDLAWKEFLGLVLYRLAWRTHDVFPGPKPP